MKVADENRDEDDKRHCYVIHLSENEERKESYSMFPVESSARKGDKGDK